ncbi:MAG: hypothetical protein EA390_03655 [Balneolaceae bacterium]|nr:MAG: hypothetical protein EA390_03655 [Balneolaceae bacterium]
MKLFHPNICTYEISLPKSDTVSVVGFFLDLSLLLSPDFFAVKLRHFQFSFRYNNPFKPVYR